MGTGTSQVLRRPPKIASTAWTKYIGCAASEFPDNRALLDTDLAFLSNEASEGCPPSLWWCALLVELHRNSACPNGYGIASHGRGVVRRSVGAT